MSDLTKKLAEKARSAGKVREGSTFFSVTDKRQVDAGGGQMVTVEVPNGQHRVKILTEKIGKGKSFQGTEQDEVQMVVLDNGVEKNWNYAIHDEKGNASYLVIAFENIEVGEEFVVVAKKMQNGKYMKLVTKIGKGGEGGEIPTINLDEEQGAPAIEEEGNIKPDEVPF